MSSPVLKATKPQKPREKDLLFTRVLLRSKLVQAGKKSVGVLVTNKGTSKDLAWRYYQIVINADAL